MRLGRVRDETLQHTPHLSHKDPHHADVAPRGHRTGRARPAGHRSGARGPGMTLCVEVLVGEVGGDFSIKLEDQVLITEDGPDCLTGFNRDLMVIA